MKKISTICLLLIVLFNFSCSTSKMNLDFPKELISSENTIYVKGTKGKGLVGTKRKLVYDKLYQGKLKEGWTITTNIFDKTPGGFFSKESFKRSLYQNLGVDINDVTSKMSDKFQFTVSDSEQTWLALCYQRYEGKSTNYDILDKVNYSKGMSQKSNFRVSFINISDTTKSNWQLELKYERETPNGIIQTFIKEGIPIETGQLTNESDTILIKQLYIKGKHLENNQYADIIKIVGGYEFILNNKTIGMVDLYKQSISLIDANNKYNAVTAAAATSLLLRVR